MKNSALNNLFGKKEITTICTVIKRTGRNYRLKDESTGRTTSATSDLYYALGSVVLARSGVIIRRAEKGDHKTIWV